MEQFGVMAAKARLGGGWCSPQRRLGGGSTLRWHSRPCGGAGS